MEENRKISLKLGIGVVFFPIIFGWFLLREGYSKKAKLLGLSWILVTTVTAILSPASPSIKKPQSDSGPSESSPQKTPTTFDLSKIPKDTLNKSIAKISECMKGNSKNNCVVEVRGIATKTPSCYVHIDEKLWTNLTDLDLELLKQFALIKFKGSDAVESLTGIPPTADFYVSAFKNMVNVRSCDIVVNGTAVLKFNRYDSANSFINEKYRVKKLLEN